MLGDQEVDAGRVGDQALAQVAKGDANERALNLAEVFRRTGLSILATADGRGGCVGTVGEGDNTEVGSGPG
ncbi:MAG: hypothetical protein ABSF83_13235 [Nitrososphaerales archaeon]